MEKRICHSKHNESELQRQCVTWFNTKHWKLRGLLFAVPNGGYRSKVEAGIMKAEGVTAGVSDLILMIPNKQHHALCIEMKTKVGRQSELQKVWQSKVEEQGYKYCICKTIDEFIGQVESYLN